MILYALRSAKDRYIITKFDDDFNPEATYEVTYSTCTCPAGQRPTCKHRKMLPRLLKVEAQDTDQFYCYETQTWHRPLGGMADEFNGVARPTEAEDEVPLATEPSQEPIIAQPKTNGAEKAAENLGTEFKNVPVGQPSATGFVRRV